MAPNAENSRIEINYDMIRAKERAEMKKASCIKFLLGAVGIGCFLLIWMLIMKLGLVDKKLIVSPLAVIQEIITKFYDKKPDGALLYEHIGASLKISLSGFVLANIIGIPLGLLMGWYKNIDRFVRPIFEVIRPIPPIAWIPIMVVILGIGLKSKMVIIFFSAFIPSLINSYTGIKLTNPVYINVGKTCGASKFTNFIYIGVPSALPMIFAGMKVSLGNSWSTLVAAEMLAATQGLGYFIMMGRTFARVDVILAGMIIIGIIGIILTSLLELLERKIIKWKV